MEVNEDQIAQYLPGVSKKLSWLSEEDLLKRVLSLEFNRLLDYYRDAPKIDFIDEKPNRADRKADRKKDREPRSDQDKDRRTAEKGMERIYVNAGKNDGFFAGNLIDLLNKTVPGKRVDVGRIDLLPGYSLFDVRKSDAQRVVEALKGDDWMGKRLYSEIAEAEKDYARASERKTKAARAPKPSYGRKKRRDSEH